MSVRACVCFFFARMLFQAFSMGAQLSQLGLVLLLTHAPHSDLHLAAAAALAAAAVAWAALFPWLPGATDGVCPVPGVGALRTAASAAVLCTVGATYALRAGALASAAAPTVLAVGWACCAAGAGGGVARARRSARAAAARRVAASALADAVALVEQVSGALCLASGAGDSWASDRGRQRGAWSRKLRAAGSVKELASLLAAFEDQVAHRAGPGPSQSRTPALCDALSSVGL
jgi:hypothetical protein